jgi:hypothetical protein
MFQLARHIRHHSSHTLQALHQQARIVELQHLADGLQQRLQEQEQQLASYAPPILARYSANHDANTVLEA